MSYQAVKKESSFAKKALLTLLLVTIYKIGTYISVPGINKDILSSMLGGTDLGALSTLMSGGALTNFSIFALGIIPYITASIIIQLLSFNMVPSLVELKKQGDFGRQKIKKITIILAVILAIFQSITMTIAFGNMYTGFIVNDTWYNYVMIATILTIGCCILIYFGETIDKKGVGNGISLLIFASILMSMPSAISSYYISNIDGSGDELFIEIIKAALLLSLVITLVAFVTFVHLSERQIPIKNIIQKSTANQSKLQTNSNKNFLPIKVIAVGVIPVIFASALMMTPTTIAQLKPDASWSQFIMNYLSMDSLSGAFLYVIVIMFFTYFYTFLQFNPDEIAKNLQGGQTFIPSIKPGAETSQYLNDVLFSMATIGALVLAFISVTPLIISTFINLPTTIQIGGISLLIIINVSLDLQKRYAVEKKKEEQKYTSLTKIIKK